MRKRVPNDDEVLASVLTGLPPNVLAEWLADDSVATEVGADDLDELVENPTELRRQLGVSPPWKRK